MGCFSFLGRLIPLFVMLTTSLCLNFVKEKGSKVSVGCTFSSTEKNTQWQVRSGNDFINVTSCTLGTNICVDYQPQQYRGEAKNTLDGFVSYLIINSVSINDTEFRCSHKYGFATNTLEIYTRPSTPSCDPVKLDYTKKNLQFTCRVNEVYPSVGGALYIRGVQLTTQDLITGHCSNEKHDSLTPESYSAVCTWRLSTDKLEPIKYPYKAAMYPNVSNTTGIPRTMSQDFNFELSSPKPVIDYTQCPVGAGVVDGKIMAGSTASCRCVLESSGFPAGQARWYPEHSNKSVGRDDTTNGSSTLVIYGNMSGESYQCRAESPLKNTHNWAPVYTPVFAVPSSNPVCDSVDVDYTKKNLQFRCRARVFTPSSSASLYIRGVNLSKRETFSDQCTNEEHDSLTLNGHSIECKWHVSAAKLDPFKYSYYVKMFPNVSNSIGIDTPYSVSQDYILQLSSPLSVIDYGHCPFGAGARDGKVITGLSASCRCMLKTPGFPPGQARWYTHNGNQSLGSDNTADGSSTLEIYANMSGQSFQCRAESFLRNPLNWGPVYTPVFIAPRSAPEAYSLRVEYVAVIVTGAIILTVIIAVILWRWRNRNRQWLDTTGVAYSTRGSDEGSVSGTAEVNHNYSKIAF